MKTDNNIDISNESLNEAIGRYPDQSTLGYNDHWNKTKQMAFIAGANWQKEKDKAIIDKLTEALKMELWHERNGEGEAQRQGKPRLCTRIEIIEQLLNQLKETK